MRGIEAKVVVLGSRGVGKTCLVTKYIKSTLNRDVGPTTAASFFTCKIALDDARVKLQIWDTAGQERFKAMAPMYYRNANAAILVFDMAQQKTFSELKMWMQELHRNVQEPIILTLVGNKLDVNAERTVTRDEAYCYASSLGANYFETCAGTDQGLEQVFHAIAMGLVRLANEGKSRSLLQFDSCESIAAYSNNNTAFSYSSAIMAEKGINGTFRLPAVHVGISVDGEDNILTTDVGRLEMPAWSIDNIALGEIEPTNWCCY